MGLSIAFAGGITLMAILVMFATIPSMTTQIFTGSISNSEINDLNDSILKTKFRISGINASSNSNLVNFTLTNEGSEKLWNYKEFDLLITYDADISGTKTRVTETFAYNATAFGESTGIEGEGPDFIVQRGCTTIADGNFDATLNAGVDYTAPTGEAFVRITNTRLSGNGNTDVGYNNPWAEIEDFGAFVRVVDFPNQIIFSRNDNPATEDTRVCYEIIDYVGLPDADNAIQVLDQNFVTYTSGSTTVSGTSVTPTDDNDVVVFITGQAGEENANTQWAEALSTANWDGVNDEPDFTRGQATGTEDDNDLSYAVVEFVGNNWKIQRVQHTYSGTAPETQSITPVNSLSQTFLHTQHISGTDTGLDTQGEEAWLSAVDEISFDLENTATFGGVVTVAWVIENTQSSGTVANVQHLSGSRSGGVSEDVFTQNIPTAVDSLSNTAIFGENTRSTGGGTAYPRGAIALEITADDTVTMYRSDEGQTQNYRFSVVEFPHSLKCVDGTSDIIEINEWTINCIKFEHLDPGIINSGEAPEILTKLQHPIFSNGILEISLTTDNGVSEERIVTVI